MGVEYPHAMVIKILNFSTEKIPRSEMGVAALDFPKGLEFSNSHQCSSSTYLVETFPALKPLLSYYEFVHRSSDHPTF